MASALGPTVHHTDRRQTCNTCGARVFTYASTDDGVHYCRTCANRLRDVPLCAYCQRRIENRDGVLVHADGKVRRHPAAREREWNYPPLPLQAQQARS